MQGRRKALLFFSEGFDYDIYQPFNREGSSLIRDTREAVAAAQRANVTVYGIDPRGLSSFGGMIEISGTSSDYPQLDFGTFRGQMNELLLAQESLMSLSEETGGLAIVNSGDLAGGLGRIVLDNSRYYLLGYFSDSTEWSRDRFMKIDVRVKRPRLEVRARKGFLPPDTEAIERAREAEVASGTSPALTAALGEPIPIGDLPLRVFAAPLRGRDGNASVLVALEIDGPSLKFEERDGRFAESIEVSIVAVDERARTQGGDRQTFDLNLTPETHARVSSTGVRTLTQLDLPPGRYQIRVGVHETTGRTIGTVPYDLEVPDYSEMPFALSGVLLTSSAAELFATANQNADWEGLLPTPPVVTRTFSASERPSPGLPRCTTTRAGRPTTSRTRRRCRTPWMAERSSRLRTRARSKPARGGRRRDSPRVFHSGISIRADTSSAWTRRPPSAATPRATMFSSRSSSRRRPSVVYGRFLLD